ncbi:unnamed protein product [Toxocara canis]|uniref:Ras-associating domain-containing protein n=1 Tax=Toxocara canis TaxID=6265 RepID=A0A183U6P6_TOXCA|nr:unnamed protein product [Toxocara canis]
MEQIALQLLHGAAEMLKAFGFTSADVLIAHMPPDDVSSTSAEDPKEKEDSEILRIYDGNSSLRNQVYRTASVPKTASVQLIRDTALRRFHITDNPESYYVTQVLNDGE